MLLYHEVDAAREAGECEKLFARNAWRGAWVDGIYSFHHCHSTAHEVLGVVAGSARSSSAARADVASTSAAATSSSCQPER